MVGSLPRELPIERAYARAVTRRWILLTTLSIAAFVLVSLVLSQYPRRGAQESIEQPGPLVLVVMPTLSWQDIGPDQTPRLWSLVDGGAVANLGVHAIAAHTCSVDGWLTLSAGARASQGQTAEPAANGDGLVCPEGPATASRGGGALMREWPQWEAESRTKTPVADLGLLASTLRDDSQCVATAGTSAAVGGAYRGGRVRSYVSHPRDLDLTRCPVSLVELTGVDDPALGRLMDRLPAEATLVVSGLADDADPERLRATVVSGPGVPQGLLTSLSTRQPGLLRTVDLTALVISRAGPIPAGTFQGRSPVVIDGVNPGDAVTRLRHQAEALDVQHRTVAPFFWTYAGLAAGSLLVGALLVRQARRQGLALTGSRAQQWGRVAGGTFGAVPAATFLVGLLPWSLAPWPALALGAGIALIAVGIGAVALLGPWRRWTPGPAVFLALGTVIVIALDVILGSRLQLQSILGLQPVYGSRFYGMGNVGFAVFATAALLAAALLAGRWARRGMPQLAASTVLVIAVAAAVVNGHPALGAETGGLLAMVPAFGYLAFRAGGLRPTGRRLAVIAVVSVLVVALLAVLDYLRPRQERSHVGDFVENLLATGSIAPLRTIVSSNWAILTAQWVNLLVPVLLVGAIAIVVFRATKLGRALSVLEARVPLLRSGLVAVLICWVLAFAANDSGTGIPPAGLLIAGPLLALLASSTAQPRYVPEPVEERAAASS